MTSSLANFAWDSIFWAIDFLSCSQSVPNRTGEGMGIHIVNTGDYGRIKECFWRRMAPILVLWRKIDVGQVAGDTCHGDGAFPPSLAKVKIEGVVFDEFVSGVVLLHSRSALTFSGTRRWTYCGVRTTRENPSNSLGDGGLLSHTEHPHCDGFLVFEGVGILDRGWFSR